MSFPLHVERLAVRAKVALLFARCRLGMAGIRVRYRKYHLNQTPVFHVSIAAQKPHSPERLSFAGLSTVSSAEACEKAFGEFLEARTIWGCRITGDHDGRSGWSCGQTLEIAARRSYLELVERDAFLMHFLAPELRSTVAESEIDRIRVAELQTSDANIHVFLAGTRRLEEKDSSKSFWMLGLGASLDPNEARQKSILEVLMIEKTWSPPAEAAGLDDAERPIQKLLTEHWRAAGAPESDSRLNRIFSGASGKTVAWYADPRLMTTVHSQKYSPSHIVAFVSHPDLLQLSFGEKWVCYETEARRKLEKRNIRIENWPIHPIL